MHFRRRSFRTSTTTATNACTRIWPHVTSRWPNGYASHSGALTVPTIWQGLNACDSWEALRFLRHFELNDTGWLHWTNRSVPVRCQYRSIDGYMSHTLKWQSANLLRLFAIERSLIHQHFAIRMHPNYEKVKVGQWQRIPALPIQINDPQFEVLCKSMSNNTITRAFAQILPHHLPPNPTRTDTSELQSLLLNHKAF